ncbi:DMT family transporter [Maribrevibacterium harenarium]|nr:DMT family transporter [Maribrevibacterium harenarium]
MDTHFAKGHDANDGKQGVFMATAASFFCLGLFFSSITVLFWGMLPIALKLSGGFSDPITLTWLRFTVAGAILLLWQWQRGKLGEFRSLSRNHWLRLFAAGSFLIVNYTLFAWSLDFMHPGSAQLSFQTSPLLLALGSLIFLKEQVRWQQWLCFAVLAAGMIIFFHPVLRGDLPGDSSTIALGFGIVQVSAASWCVYALLQKSLYHRLSSANILLAIYLFALVVMLPFTHPAELVLMSTTDMLIAGFCCLNTVIAYGAFAQAMRYWQTVQVSAAVALTPIAAFILTEVSVSLSWWPEVITSSHADSLSLFGMGLVVSAAITVQLLSVQFAKQANRRAAAIQLTAETKTLT